MATAAGLNIPDELIGDIKLYLGITWSDTGTDKSVADFIADGIRYIDGKIGQQCDYTVAGDARTLLKEYVRYARSYALDVFELNYRPYLLGAQHDRMVSEYAAISSQCGCNAEF